MCVCNRFYTHFAFIWEVWRLPHENRSSCNSFFSPANPRSPCSPHFQTTHSKLIDGPLDPGLLSSRSTCFTGLWATWRIRTNALVTQAGQGNCGVGASELQSMAEGALLQLNHLIRSWWLHLAGISPPHTSREAASDMVINCRVNTSISEVSGLYRAARMATQFTVTTNQETLEAPHK